jgi:hypothetical protein
MCITLLICIKNQWLLLSFVVWVTGALAIGSEIAEKAYLLVACSCNSQVHHANWYKVYTTKHFACIGNMDKKMFLRLLLHIILCVCLTVVVLILKVSDHGEAWKGGLQIWNTIVANVSHGAKGLWKSPAGTMIRIEVLKSLVVGILALLSISLASMPDYCSS